MGFPLGWMGVNGQVRGAEGFMQCVCNGAEGDLCALCIGGVLRGSCTMCVCRGVVRAVQGLECVWSGVLGGMQCLRGGCVEGGVLGFFYSVWGVCGGVCWEFTQCV